MADFYITLGATKPSLLDNLTSAGDPVDLTGASVFFNLTKYGSPVIINGAGVIVDAVGGTVRYDPSSNQFNSQGTFEGSWKVVFPNSGGTQYFPSDRYLIVEVI